MKKHILALLLSLIVMFVVPIVAEAQIIGSGECGRNDDKVTWTLDDAGALTISGKGMMYEAWSSYYQPWKEFREQIKSVVVENGITGIAHSAFAECPNLKQVSLSDSVTSLPIGVFENCTSLEEINIPKNVESIDFSSVFHGCSSLKAINVDEKNNKYCSVDGVLYSKDMKTLEAYPAGKTDETFSVPNGVEMVGYVSNNISNNMNYPFTNDYIKNINLPDSVNSIGIKCANLVSINLPIGITTINIRCPKLTEFDLPTGLSTIWKLTCGAEYIKLPDTVSTIQQNAFLDCENLSYIVIPKSVTEIFTNAFENCPALRDIYYDGDKEEWSQILCEAAGGPDIDYLKDVTVHFNDTPPQINQIEAYGNDITVHLTNVKYMYNLIAAVYDNGILRDVKTVPVFFGDTEINTQVNTEYFDEVKAFIWDCKSLCPLCEAGQLTME